MAGAKAITRNGLNQPTAVNSVATSSDPRGNLTFDGVKGFTFDTANRLTGTGSASLSYDPLDRLAQMVGTTGGRYLYDGDEIAGVVTAPTGTTINNRIIRGPWPDELLVAYQGNTASTPLWSLQDHQSSVIAITDAAGNASFTLGYDEYGQPRSGNAGRLMYTGQLWMPDFGLYHYKARAYHPGLGRFLQTDPVGYEQGMNLYAYVGLDPMNRTDPTGKIVMNTGFDGGQDCGGTDQPVCEVEDIIIVGPAVTLVRAPRDFRITACFLNSCAEARSPIYVPFVYPRLYRIPSPYAHHSRPTGAWPASSGSEEWGRRNGVGAKEGKRRFHDLKQDTLGSRGDDDYTVNPGTGEVYDQDGESVGNLNDED